MKTSSICVLLLLGVQSVRIHSNDVFDDPDQAEDLKADWMEKQTNDIANKIDLEGPKT